MGPDALPFARYVNAVHRRLHRVFVGDFLSSLDQLPAGDPLRAPGLTNGIELVVNGDTGQIVALSVVHPSGLAAFDAGALRSFRLAAPFGKAPREIRSADGFVYLTWELRRDAMACSPYDVHPWIFTR